MAKPRTTDGYEVYNSSGGTKPRWYWRLRRRGRIVADGAEDYTRKTDALRAVRSLRKWAAGASVFVKE